MSNGELRKVLSDFGVNRIDRIKFWFTRLSGKRFLATRQHVLLQAGISPGGAALMVKLVEAVITKEIIVEGKTVTLPNPQKFDILLETAGALGLEELSEKGDPSTRLCNDLGMLTSGSEYIFAYAETGSKWAKLEGGLETHQGTLDRITDLYERDAAAALETQLEEKYGASVVFKLEKAMLTAPARKPASGVQTNKKPQGSVPDGAFLVKVDDAQIVYVLEAKFDGDGDVTNARRQLDGYEEAAKRLFSNAEIVKVYGHQGITAETEAELKKLGIKSIELIGNMYTPLQ